LTGLAHNAAATRRLAGLGQWLPMYRRNITASTLMAEGVLKMFELCATKPLPARHR